MTKTASPILISACLLGREVRYDGKANLVTHPALARWRERDRLVAVCPEVAGGLGTPRPPAEMTQPAGAAVLAGDAKVMTTAGVDVTAGFRIGAEFALRLATEQGARVAILKARSPSCGNIAVYDGTFTGTVVDGEGVTAALLRQNGIRVFSEEELDAAAEFVAALDQGLAT